MALCGTADDHCCWYGGEMCQYVVPSEEPGFKWACLLRVREGLWSLVHQTAEYLANVKPKLLAAGVGVDCGDWPPPGVTCGDCGQIG